MGWGWLKKVGKGLNKYAKPIVGIALPGVGQAISMAEDIVETIKESDPDIVITGIVKEDLALSSLLHLIDKATGDHLTDEQEELARVAFRANVAFINSLKDG